MTDPLKLHNRVSELLMDRAYGDRIHSIAWANEPNVVTLLGHDGSIVVERDTTNAEQLWMSISGENPLPEAQFPGGPDQLLQFFDSPVAPNVLVLHQATHRFHGNAGDHGMLDRSMAQAPFMVSGCGFSAEGNVARHLHMVDVAPTLAALMGCAPNPQVICDGSADRTLLTGERPDHLVVFLIDGTNPENLRQALAEGQVPAIASLATHGTTYDGGVLASLPTATLANHTVALTGAHPGHSGILHNTWLDHSNGTSVDLLDGKQMFGARNYISSQVETLHETIHRNFPDAYTTAMYEYADRGADWSTFIELDQGRRVPQAADRADDAHPLCLEDPACGFITTVDAASSTQAAQQWGNGTTPNPTFQWVNFSLTDETGHRGGPLSELARMGLVDTDRRIGRVLQAIDDAGVRERTAFVVLADHGMNQTDDHEPLQISQLVGDLLNDAPYDATVVDQMFVYFDPM